MQCNVYRWARPASPCVVGGCPSVWKGGIYSILSEPISGLRWRGQRALSRTLSGVHLRNWRLETPYHSHISSYSSNHSVSPHGSICILYDLLLFVQNCPLIRQTLFWENKNKKNQEHFLLSDVLYNQSKYYYDFYLQVSLDYKTRGWLTIHYDYLHSDIHTPTISCSTDCQCAIIVHA